MKITEQGFAFCFRVDLKPLTGLLLRSGKAGEFSDSAVETTSDGCLHINGYVWASLLCRSLARCGTGRELAARWGSYKPEGVGVAPLWMEAAFLEEKDFLPAVNAGNRIDRQWGSVAEAALYSDEVAYPLKNLPLSGTVFCQSQDEAAAAAKALGDALWVINRGIETIGGGWSYGFGRLRAECYNWSILDLRQAKDRERLWRPEPENWEILTGEEIDKLKPEIAPRKDWSHFHLRGRIVPGQLLAIHTEVPELGAEIGDELPDSFVFTRPVVRNGSLAALPVITGKAFRQAVLSREIERRLRSCGDGACLNSSDPGREPVVRDESKKRRCRCKRCLWFGDTDAGGVIAVGDALVENHTSEIVNRIQVCEHSRQTMHKKLFNGQYLTGGDFVFDLVIDHSRAPETSSRELEEVLGGLFEEMNPANKKAPPGWYRLGATSTCTGQLEIKKITKVDYRGAGALA